MVPDDFPASGYAGDYAAFWAIWLAVVGATVFYFKRSRGRPGRLRLVAGNALVFVALLWTAVVAGETYLRYVYDDTEAFGLTLTTRAWMIRHVRRNAEGFRDREWTQVKATGVARVACVGDSFTMGSGVREPSDCWPQVIGRALEERFPGRFEVRNYGVPGFSTRREVDLVEALVARGNVDSVVIGYCLNDTNDLLPPDRYFYANSVPRVPWLAPTTSFLADFLWFRGKQRFDPRVLDYGHGEEEAYADAAIWEVQRGQLARLVETCRKGSVRLHVAVFPLFSDWGPAYRYHACHDLVLDEWRKLGVDAVDLRDAYRGVDGADLVVNRYDAHPNETAHRLAARAVLARAFDAK
jgi:hypothetical protein